MFLLHCPHCGELRDEQEFGYAGEAFIARPARPEAVDDALWGDYLFMRQNPKGWLWEQWQHTAACRKVFVVKRHTASYEVAGSWTLAEGQALWLTEMSRATARDMDPRMQTNPQGATA
ncbi:sarcosine oxidase subunit delta [Verminephrobacter eiseniae]|uniref:sarcosine oxidase subunit delta n=1 Tax=Verminephrobacter eiseniae TaxID=364317 RepID=UPI0022387B59|nr:sarcosine oxidase subunit delta [Verminephrobacter eiseniae]MCW5231831.1 sarcosine oxidase subunit delta [Verminephrobacter eiseniae]MCW5293565.1 sarcosine oxidase subunit delta [Verminephrobacter eiseniae]MCW8186141.1 sarcosine oxidase subunit delta [Verminephrobacter eiseniae]MCW8224618.1 sarcosine oxidase subunit delta [Verminephrobacter eiseniae]MCW8233236.1 sarcosine oxidase subunit delta [Verminephrobacter eiseniae]